MMKRCCSTVNTPPKRCLPPYFIQRYAMLLAGDEFGTVSKATTTATAKIIRLHGWIGKMSPMRCKITLKELIRVRSQIKLLTDDCWWEKERVQWLNADSSPMTEYCWHNRAVRRFRSFWTTSWLLLVNAKRSSSVI